MKAILPEPLRLFSQLLMTRWGNASSNITTLTCSLACTHHHLHLHFISLEMYTLHQPVQQLQQQAMLLQGVIIIHKDQSAELKVSLGQQEEEYHVPQ